MKLTYRTAIYTENKVPCKAEVHDPAFAVDFTYSNCKDCGGTANNPKTVQEIIDLEIEVHPGGDVTIPIGCKLPVREVVKIFKLSEIARHY